MTLHPHLSTALALVEEIEGLNASLMLSWGDDDEAQRIEGAILQRQYELAQACNRVLGCDLSRVAMAMGGSI